MIERSNVLWLRQSCASACLESLIAFQLPAPRVDKTQWLATLRDHSAVPRVLDALRGNSTHGALGRLRESVQRMRQVALVTAITLALYLLRRATCEPDPQHLEMDLRLLQGIQHRDCCYREAA
jgi:hypothetical protein